MRRTLTSIGAILLLALLLIGLPIVLVAIGPVGLAHVEPTMAGLWAALLRPDDGTLFLTLVKAAGWVVWALLAIAVLTELVAVTRHMPAPTLRGLGLPQGVARALVTAAVAVFLNTNSTLTAPLPADAHGTAPAAAPAAPTQPHAAPATVEKAEPTYQRHIVKKGDILSQLALDHLGDAHRYPEIFEASKHLRQPGGTRLTDPDVIDIGWKLNIPTDHKPADKPAKTSKPKPVEPEPTETEPTGTIDVGRIPPATPSAPAATSTAAASTPGATAEAPDHVDGDAAAAEPAWLLSGLAGAGAVLAGSLWLLLQRRRAIQHHHRRPGYATAPPPPHTIPVEKTLRHQGAPLSDHLLHIDETLRRLAATLLAAGQPLPVLVAAEATPAVLRLHLAEDATLPDPWQQEDTAKVWNLDFADIPDDLEPLEPDGPAPWPHLATVGADDAGHRWLLNLETAGITTIAGHTDYAEDLARYLAAELATSPWSRDIRVDLIDVFDELTDLDPRRLRHHTANGIDDTIRAAVDTMDRLGRLHETDLAAARASQAGDEIWLSRVLIANTTTGRFDQLAKLIHDQPRRTSTAAVLIGVTDSSGPALQITVGADGRALVPALGLDLVANGITRDEAAGCVQLIQAAEELSDTDVPTIDGEDGSWRQFGDQAGRLRATLTEPRRTEGTTDPSLSNLPQPDAAILATAATTAADLAVLAPEVPEQLRQQVADTDPTLDVDLAEWWSKTCQRPRLSVLGPVHVRVGSTGKPGEVVKRKPYYTELVAYLATKPEGATTQQLCEAFATTPARIQRDLAVVRAWLDRDPATGQRYLPDAALSNQINDGRRRYRLHGLLYDADLFRRLRIRGQTRGNKGINDYLQALRLVNGSPYSELRPSGGTWMAGDRDDQNLVVGIVDLAHLTVNMALQEGDLDTAHRAARIGATAAPDEQTPKLDLIAIAEADGDQGVTMTSAAAMLQHRDSDGPVEPGSRAAALMEARGWSRSGVGG
jgi:LysM repeat protein